MITMRPSDRGRLLYASPNGDSWQLRSEPTTGRCFVRHTGNVPSGGHVTDVDLTFFLASGGNGPEHQELWRLITALIDTA